MRVSRASERASDPLARARAAARSPPRAHTHTHTQRPPHSATAAYVVPAYQNFKAIEKKQNDDVREWGVYW